MPPDIRHLQHVAAIGQYRSFSRAAKALAISQPALSKSIRTLESALGVRLFERGQGGVTRPTVFGDLVLARAGAMIRNLDDLVAEVQRVKGLAAGSLSVGAGFFPYDISVGPALVRLARSHPTLHLHAVRSDWRTLVRHVLDGTVDVAVCEVTAAEREPSVTVERLPERTGSFFVRRDHPLAGAASLSLGELAPYPFSLTPVPPRAAAAFLQAGVPGRLDTATGDFLPSVTVDSIALMKDIVRETNAFGWVPRFLIRSELAKGEFVPLPLEPPWAKTLYGIIRLIGRSTTPAQDAFIREVKAVESEVSAAESEAPTRLVTAGGRDQARGPQRHRRRRAGARASSSRP